MSKDNLTLDLVLKSEWFDKIKSGEKRIEYRLYNDYWKKRIEPLGVLFFYRYYGTKIKPKRSAKALFSRGYARKEQMLFMIDEISVVHGNDTDLHIDAPVFAIHLGERIY